MLSTTIVDTKMGDEGEANPSRESQDEQPRVATPNLDVSGMFSALLQEMRMMNSNFSSLNPPPEDEDNSASEQEDNGETLADGANTALERLVGEHAEDAQSKDEDVLNDIAQDLNADERMDPAINEKLAGIFNNLLKSKLSEDKLKEKMDKYVRPSNMADLKIPRVNTLIWNQLSDTMKAQDRRAQKSQGILMGSINAGIKAANLAITKYAGDRELIKLLSDCVALALQHNHEVNQGRRVAMKKELHKDYAAICNAPAKEDGNSEFLFGDLSKVTKEITEANKLTKKVRPAKSNHTRDGRNYQNRSNYSGAGYNRFRPYDKNRSNFLHRGQSSKFKKKKEGNNH